MKLPTLPRLWKRIEVRRVVAGPTLRAVTPPGTHNSPRCPHSCPLESRTKETNSGDVSYDSCPPIDLDPVGLFCAGFDGDIQNSEG